MTTRRFPATTARAVAEKLISELRVQTERIEIAGSLRRNRPFVHDIDVVAFPSADADIDLALRGLVARGSLNPVRDGGKIKHFIASKTGIPIDIYFAAAETFPALLLIRTGSKNHNIKLAMRARDLGLKLRASGDGIEQGDGKMITVECEEDVFRILGLPYLPPEKRE